MRVDPTWTSYVWVKNASSMQLQNLRWFNVILLNRPGGATTLLQSASNAVVPGTGVIWMDDVKCQATESRLVNCPHRGFNSSDCTHAEDVGVQCPVSAQTPGPTMRPPTTPAPVVPDDGNCKKAADVFYSNVITTIHNMHKNYKERKNYLKKRGLGKLCSV